VLFTIEITGAAADVINKSLVEGKVVRMFLAAIDSSGATYGLALDDQKDDDKVFESRGVKIHMDPKDAELLSETIIDYVDDGIEKGFIIRGPEDDVSSCGSCANADVCEHDHSSCDHEHGDCGHDHGGCGCH
jgi:iron-sulfur cluster assembly protein